MGILLTAFLICLLPVVYVGVLFLTKWSMLFWCRSIGLVDDEFDGDDWAVAIMLTIIFPFGLILTFLRMIVPGVMNNAKKPLDE